MTNIAAANGGIELTPKGAAYVAAFRPSGCPRGVDPADWRAALEHRIDRHLGLVQALLAMLDDGADPDLEPNEDDEPSLGGNAVTFEAVDCELDDADREPDVDDEDGADNEYWLGWAEQESRRGHLSGMGAGDLEHDDSDYEPSLGAPETALRAGGYHCAYAGAPLVDCCTPLGDQASWARGRGDDDEATNEDGDPTDYGEGEGVFEGGNEQVAP